MARFTSGTVERVSDDGRVWLVDGTEDGIEVRLPPPVPVAERLIEVCRALVGRPVLLRRDAWGVATSVSLIDAAGEDAL